MIELIEKNSIVAGHRQRLRERFLKAGRGALADYELLELLLTYSIPRKNTKPMAKALLSKFGSFINALQQPRHRLQEINGIGPQTATFLMIVQACLTRFTESEVEQQVAISGPDDIFAFIRLHLGQLSNECLYTFYLDEARRVVHHAEVGAGTVDRAPLYPREILKPALLHNATAIILVHNHPDGQPVPSERDMEMTTKLEKIAASLNIKLLDHMVVTRLQAYSIKTGKLL
jgi:DNA repair protein RadC